MLRKSGETVGRSSMPKPDEWLAGAFLDTCTSSRLRAVASILMRGNSGQPLLLPLELQGTVEKGSQPFRFQFGSAACHFGILSKGSITISMRLPLSLCRHVPSMRLTGMRSFDPRLVEGDRNRSE